jgi:hypothetical protein
MLSPLPSLRDAAFLAALLLSTSAQARGCYGRGCESNGMALVLLAPLVIIYLRFWNRRKGGPSFWQCVGYAVVAAVAALAAGGVAITLRAPGWIHWAAMALAYFATFTLLIHPRRHT